MFGHYYVTVTIHAYKSIDTLWHDTVTRHAC